MSGDMSKTKDRKDSDFNDAIELMFFAYRDLLLILMLFWRPMILAAPITVFCTLSPVIRAFP